jgi:glycine/D-amino acid oxidase-like deaminating enzyme
MTKYGRTPWLARFPKSRVPSYPRHRGNETTDAVIVGGGLTGCATAYAFAAAGIDVVLLEAAQIGRGVTGASGGWIADDPGVAFGSVEKALGLRAARRAWGAWRRAALDFQALLRRLDVKCYLEPHDTITVGLTSDETDRLRREAKARRDAGLEAILLNARSIAPEVGIPAAGGLKSHDGATIDPYRASIGLASAARARGARVFERTGVVRITFTRKYADVATRSGKIRTNRVIVATSAPTALFRPLARHFWFRRSFLAVTAPIPARVREQLGRRTAVLRDMAAPPHAVRWLDDTRLLVTGADMEDRGPAASRQREQLLVQRTGQLMYELSTLYPEISGIAAEYGWDAPYARTGDGLPYIGPHRNYPFHLFAFGDSSHSVTGAYLASRIFVRHHRGESDPADRVFGFHR